MADEMVVKHIYPPPDDQVRIKLTRNSKGYGWEISVAGKDGDEALAKLWDVEQQLKAEYRGEEE